MDEASPKVISMTGVSAGGHLVDKKTVSLIPKVSHLEQVRKES